MQPQDRPFKQLISNLELGCQVNFIVGNHFLWTREEFQTWAKTVAQNNNYEVHFAPIGEEDKELGAPSQMAIFKYGN